MSARETANGGRDIRREGTVAHGGWTGRLEGVDAKGRGPRRRSGRASAGREMPSHIPRPRHLTSAAARHPEFSPPPQPPPPPPPPPQSPQRGERKIKTSATTRLKSPLGAKMHPVAGAGDAVSEHEEPMIRYPLPPPPRCVDVVASAGGEVVARGGGGSGGRQLEKESSTSVKSRSPKESLLVFVDLRKQPRDDVQDIKRDTKRTDAAKKHHKDEKKKNKKKEKKLEDEKEKDGRAEEETEAEHKQTKDVLSDISKASQHTIPSSPHLSAFRFSSLSSVSSGDGDDSMPERREVRDRLRSWLSQEQLSAGKVKAIERRKCAAACGGGETEGSGYEGSTSSGASPKRHYDRLSRQLFQAATKCPLPQREAVAAVEKLKRRAARIIATQQIGRQRDRVQSRALSAPPRNHPTRRHHGERKKTARSSSDGDEEDEQQGEEEEEEEEEEEGEEEEEETESGEMPRDTSVTAESSTSEEKVTRRETFAVRTSPSDEKDISLSTHSTRSNYMSCFSSSECDKSSRLSITTTTGVSSTTVVDVPQNNFKAKWTLSNTVHLARACVLLVLSGVLLDDQRVLWNGDQPFNWEFSADGSIPIDFDWPIRFSSPALEVGRVWNWVSGAAGVTAALSATWGAVVGDPWAADAGPYLATVALAADAAALLYAGALLVPGAGVKGALVALSGPAYALCPRLFAITASVAASTVANWTCL